MASINQKAERILQQQHAEFWNASLDPLLVQNVFRYIVGWTPGSDIKNCFAVGLPVGRLSFLLVCTGVDIDSTDPTEFVGMALLLFKLVSTLQLPTSHNCSQLENMHARKLSTKGIYVVS